MEEKARERKGKQRGKRLFVVDLDRLPMKQGTFEEFSRRVYEELGRVIDQLPDTIADNEILGLLAIVLGVVERLACVDPKFFSSPVSSAVEAIAERFQRAIRDARALWAADVKGQRPH